MELQQKASITREFRMEIYVYPSLVTSIKELELSMCEQWSMHNLPLKDELLKSARFTKFQERENASFSQIEYFVTRLVLVPNFVYMNAK